MRGAALIQAKTAAHSPGAAFLCRQHASKSLVTPNRERIVSRPQGGAIAGAQETICLPPSNSLRGGTPAWRARHALHPALGFPISRFLVALAALPFLLVFMAAASWLSWMCFQGVMGHRAPPSSGRHSSPRCPYTMHTGMALGDALSLVALVGLAGLVWVVFALLAVG